MRRRVIGLALSAIALAVFAVFTMGCDDSDRRVACELLSGTYVYGGTPICQGPDRSPVKVRACMDVMESWWRDHSWCWRL